METGFETGSVRGKTEHFALPGPFRWQVGEASDAHAVRERPSMAALKMSSRFAAIASHNKDPSIWGWGLC